MVSIFTLLVFDRITIANCDSAPSADAKAAIDMASRAVDELG